MSTYLRKWLGARLKTIVMEEFDGLLPLWLFLLLGGLVISLYISFNKFFFS